MTQIIAITRCHYGKDYLDAVIRSTAGFAEKHIVAYSPVPTFGRGASMPCPDSRDELYKIARDAGGDRLRWIEDRVPSIYVAFDEYPEADLILELDADEVIHQDLGRDITERFERGELDHYRYRLPMTHHWRNFHLTCHDDNWPERLYLPKAAIQETAFYARTGTFIHHFGYARRDLDTRYKWQLSIHADELRPEWWSEIWDSFPDRLEDIHPVNREGFWNAVPFADGLLPAALINHPYRGLEVVK
jgi:hypothetical protein